ncbi:hypothetical protein PHJA_000485900 [Phtheirospermum japonicum]|uniref:Uncharacterized protein n=1 Tax=Phtheirospermum japonicum TaxID=374723 RepID=A0A830BHR6_9LAMI|nr:hypothetical protein PHJA_000485900 [Phtheirospermum japonicum]
MLHTEPSFSIYSKDDKFGDEAENEDLIKEKMEKSATTRQSLESQFSFGSNSMRIIEEDDDEDEEGQKERAMNPSKDFDESGPSNFDQDGDLDNYYSKLVEENPSNSLVLRNYAQYLESNRDFSAAEEHYYRATLADPKDGEILSEYAQLVWDIHGDRAKASDYFERAVRAAPENSNVLASYASFMWRIDDESGEEEEDESQSNNTRADEFKEVKRPSSPPLHLAMGLGIDGYDIDLISARLDESNNVEEYHRRMVEKNPRNPSSLRNYARFLHQTKGDLNGAEEYYSRAILEDPNDGQTLSVYAGILWQLHGDRDRANAYFERAVLATPEDSNVLAARAKFLWETEEDDAQGV